MNFEDFTDEQFEGYHELKEQGLENILGRMHELVGHSIISFHVGGAVDMYYFPNDIPGTGFATMELLDPAGNGPKPNRLGTFELVAFTKELYNVKEYEVIGEGKTAFDLIERRICGIFTRIANYSFEAVLNPFETCELPDDNGDIYLIFDNYKPNDKEFIIGERKHHLLLCMEIFKSEMDFGRANGGESLVKLLKQTGFYPYSDLDRKAVV